LETDRGRRDAIFAELGDVYMRAESYDRLEDADGSDALAVDEAGNLETWADALRLQREGIEPQSFAGVTARVLMVHGEVDPHPGAATRDVLRRFVPQLEYVVLELCGHEPCRERRARERFINLARECIRGS
jgi:pimeloyl-ACP methyl ester carboxylesterase